MTIRATGKTLPELFVSAAAGMFAVMAPDPKTLTRDGEFIHELSVKAMDTESLLVEWLTELLGIVDLENVYLEKFKITGLDDSHVTAHVSGARINGFATEIKAVTYHDLKIEQTLSLIHI